MRLKCIHIAGPRRPHTGRHPTLDVREKEQAGSGSDPGQGAAVQALQQDTAW